MESFKCVSSFDRLCQKLCNVSTGGLTLLIFNLMDVDWKNLCQERLGAYGDANEDAKAFWKDFVI
ncbi:hypothetical protein N7520_010142 [Penicillium odoratum]|uniref:uncharacterized protein n=1 Tax=Penicillium odoratum TaxID=1167516 RepID=UPI0025473439|nr:uncharacterized protein N7520_010142 [Penicillium odoratum]KAJ5753225.1 hypothetical protein N7520_010142 [Penicillium odoratum]